MSGIRLADIPDVNPILELGYELLNESEYVGVKMDDSKFKMTIAGLIGHKRGIVLAVVDDNNVAQGFIAGIVEEYGFSRARFATDMWTYIRKPYRRYAYRLYKRFIAWAKTKPRVAYIEMAQSSGGDGYESWCKLMEILGFKKVGSIYMMRVGLCPVS